MTERKNAGGLDAFKLISAFLVIAIHTSPLASIQAEADFFLTRILARTAVPFFLTVTGYFVLSDYYFDRRSMYRVWKYLKKLVSLYAVSILIYLPAGLYAGHYDALDLPSLFRMLVFDGSFYHLWYFPACMLGLLLVCLLRRLLSVRGAAVAAVVLYFIGLSGDSYYGLISYIPWFKGVLDTGFQFFSYTRNGLFLAPLFLILGAHMSRKKAVLKPVYSCLGLTASFLSMTAEAFVLRYFQIQRHDSMYIMLWPCMYFLYPLLLTWSPSHTKGIRTVSTWMYILHPVVIIAVRGFARMIHMTTILVDNSLIHYLTVCALSVAAGAAVNAVLSSIHPTVDPRGRAWIELDRFALRHNVSVLRSLLPKNCELMPVVKANAYGHGAVLIAEELNRMGVYSFCVASAEEGVELRRNGITGDILILGYTHPTQFGLLRRYRLMQTVVDYDYAAEMNRYGKKLRVHIGIDTGMHRIGIKSENLAQICSIFEMKHLLIEGAFTHLCTDNSRSPEHVVYTKRQARMFADMIHELCRRGYTCPKTHLLASGGICGYPELAGDYARPGIALYGVRSCKNDLAGSHADFRPVLTLKARIASVRELMPGEGAGYGLAFRADAPVKLAVLTIGYADGLPRTLSCGAGAALIRGYRAPIAGWICMDQTMVDVTDIPNVRAGETAVLIGSSENETISVYDLAEADGTISNEILSGLGRRLNRLMQG